MYIMYKYNIIFIYIYTYIILYNLHKGFRNIDGQCLQKRKKPGICVVLFPSSKRGLKAILQTYIGIFRLKIILPNIKRLTSDE